MDEIFPEILIEFSTLSPSGLSHEAKLLITVLISLLLMVLFKLFMSSGFNFGIWYTIRNSSTLGGYPAFDI